MPVGFSFDEPTDEISERNEIMPKLSELEHGMVKLTNLLHALVEVSDLKNTINAIGNLQKASDSIELIKKQINALLESNRRTTDVVANTSIEVEKLTNDFTALHSKIGEVAIQRQNVENTYYTALEQWQDDVQGLRGQVNTLLGRSADAPIYAHAFTERTITKEVVNSFIRTLGTIGLIPSSGDNAQYRDFYYLMYHSVLGSIPERTYNGDARIDTLSQAHLLACYNWLYLYAQKAAMFKLTPQ